MPAPEELTFDQLRERIRRWVTYFWKQAEEGNLNRKDFAESIGFAAATISNLLNGTERPGILCFYRLHWRLGADPLRMLREDPPNTAAVRPKARKKAT